MFRFILALVLFFAFPVLATDNIENTADMSGLTDQQKAEVLKSIVDAKATANVTPDISTPEKVGEWVGIGNQIAELIPVFAEKTGIAADKVLNSTAGQILLTIVLVKYFWGKICGVLFLTLGTLAWWNMFKKTFLVKNMNYVPHPNSILNWFGVRQKVVEYANFKEVTHLWNEDSNVGWLFVAFIAAGILNMLFGVIGIMN